MKGNGGALGTFRAFVLVGADEEREAVARLCVLRMELGEHLVLVGLPPLLHDHRLLVEAATRHQPYPHRPLRGPLLALSRLGLAFVVIVVGLLRLLMVPLPLRVQHRTHGAAACGSWRLR
jgi:hypothetical protein